MVNATDTKKIIDDHFTQKYDYYRRVCAKYYNGRYLTDDMLHELYLAFFNVRPEIILQFNAIGKLQNIGGKIILSLYCKRNQGNKNKGKQSSALHELPMFDIDIVGDMIVDDSVDECKHEQRENQLSNMDVAIDKLLRDPNTWFSTQVFLECQTDSILALSKKTKISRGYLTKAYKRGNELLLNEIKK